MHIRGIYTNKKNLYIVMNQTVVLHIIENILHTNTDVNKYVSEFCYMFVQTDFMHILTDISTDGYLGEIEKDVCNKLQERYFNLFSYF